MVNEKTMKKNDKILILIVLIIALIGFAVVQILQSLWSDEDALAIVTYDNTQVIQIYLSDGEYDVLNNTYLYTIDQHQTLYGDFTSSDDQTLYEKCFTEDNIYCVQGKLGPVVIEYANNTVNVIYETSPFNSCRSHGPTNSPVTPIICLPNLVTINIVSQAEDDTYIEGGGTYRTYSTRNYRIAPVLYRFSSHL